MHEHATAVTHSHPVRRLGISEIEARLNVERTTIWRWYKAGRFPAPHYLGARRAWLLSEVEDWERARMSEPPRATSPGTARPR